MKKLLFFAFALSFGSKAMAQTYTPVAVTGYNADVVANGAGTVISSTTHDVDGVNFNFVAPTFVNPANATPTSSLPASGLVTSAVAATPGLTYQLASYSGNNSLRLTGDGSGTLTFPAGIYADQVYVLATSGSGATNTNITVTFSDNSTQVFSQAISDWYDATGFAIQGISRVNRTNDAIENSTTNPRLYQYQLTLSQANLSKTIQSITFEKINPAGVLNVMGITVRGIASPPAIDAGIMAITSPANAIMQNVSMPVSVRLMNQGTTALTSATITWTVNGVAQPNYTWTGNLALNQSAVVTLGNFTFTPGSQIINACVTNPNGGTDANTVNDCATVTLNACNVLTGTYTIEKNNPAANYQTIASAIAAMSSCGISGPVTFNVVAGSGPYSEQVEIPAIAGASATNTITFNGNGNTISADAVTGNRPIIRLNGADYVTLNNFIIATTGTSTTAFGWGIHLTNGADFNTINGNTINIGSLSTTESNSAGIVFSGSNTTVTTTGNTGNNNIISGNTITGGYNGIVLYSQAASMGNNQLINNTIRDFYANGIKIGSANRNLVEGNNISRPARVTVTTFAGVELNGSSFRNTISKNRIHTSHGAASSLTGTSYGVYSNANDAPVGFENLVKNNVVYNINSNGTTYGLYNSNSDGVYYYHNTINLDNVANTTTVRGFYQLTAANNIRLLNNILNVAGGTTGAKHAIYYGTTTSNIRSNNNDLFVTGGASTSGIGFFTSNRLTLADWRTGSGDDSISVSVDPQFVPGTNANYLPTNAALNDTGLPVVPAVTDDITGALRNPATPDPGAYEMGIFTPATNDVGVTAFISPVSGCNLTSPQIVTIIIQNFGTTPVSNIPVSYTVNGGTPVTAVTTGPIAPGASATYTFTTPITLTGAGSYTIVATANIPGDAVPANNSLTVVVTSSSPAAVPTITAGGPTAICGTGSVTLTAASTTAGATYTWFNNGTAIAGATNATYTATAAGSYTAVASDNGCPSAPSAATSVTVTAGPAIPTTNTGGTATNFCAGGSVTISVTTPVTGVTYQWANNGTAIAGATGNSFIANAAGSYTVTATSGSCNASSAATVVTVNAAPATPTVTAGGATTFCTGGSVVLTAASTTTGATYTWFNNGTAITGATSASYTANAAGNYTAVATANGCSSPASTATAVTVTAAPVTPTITAGGATTFCTGGSVTLTGATSTTGVTYQWLNNGTPITGATSATFTANTSGTYTIRATSGTCSATSAATTITVNPTPATPTISQNGFVLTSSSATGNQWLLNGTPITGATNGTYTTTSNGTYTVIVTANGCPSAASAAVSIINTGINEAKLLNVSIYPNPSKGFFQVVLPAGQVYEIVVMDLTGKVISKQTTKEAKTQLDLNQAAKGIYLLKLVSEGKTATRKLIVE